MWFIAIKSSKKKKKTPSKKMPAVVVGYFELIMLFANVLSLTFYSRCGWYIYTTRQSVACNARRHPVFEHQNT